MTSLNELLNQKTDTYVDEILATLRVYMLNNKPAWSAVDIEKLFDIRSIRVKIASFIPNVERGTTLILSPNLSIRDGTVLTEKGIHRLLNKIKDPKRALAPYYAYFHYNPDVPMIIGRFIKSQTASALIELYPDISFSHMFADGIGPFDAFIPSKKTIIHYENIDVTDVRSILEVDVNFICYDINQNFSISYNTLIKQLLQI